MNLALIAMSCTPVQIKTLRHLAAPPQGNWWIPPATRRVLVRKGLIVVDKDAFKYAMVGRNDGVQLTELGRQVAAILSSPELVERGVIADSDGNAICAAERHPDGTVVPVGEASESER